MLQYQQLIKDVLAFGEWKENRTGTPALTLEGAHLYFNMGNGDFPAVTLKELKFDSVKGEFVSLLKGATNAATFRANGTKIWDANANDPGKEGSPNPWLSNLFRQGQDDLGPIYGAQWRRWPAYKTVPDYMLSEELEQYLAVKDWKEVSRNGETDPCLAATTYFKEIDQFAQCVTKIITTPHDRRILFHAWNPAQLDEMALPPCHLLYQFIPNPTTGTLSMTMYMRSADIFLGVPFNLASCGLMLALMARVTGYKPHRLAIFMGDAHIYANHMLQAKEMLKRTPLTAPKLRMYGGLPYNFVPEGKPTYDALCAIEDIKPSDFELLDYQHQGELKGKMAV